MMRRTGRSQHVPHLFALVWTSAAAFQLPPSNLNLRATSAAVMRVPRGAQTRHFPSARSLCAAAEGTALVAAENKPHNGFMHVEMPDRVTTMWDLFGKSGLQGRCQVLDAREATEDELLKVHTPEHVKAVVEGTAQKDPSTYFHKKNGASSTAARLAAGGTIQVMEAVCEGRAANGFCATRPPGHHAEPEHMMGFCIFNSVAVAAQVAKEKYAKKRILIFDWDVHHGNGIQSAFFSDPEVLYMSVHRGGVEQSFFYPGSGTARELGEGAGEGYNINIPIELAGSGDAVYEMAMQRLVLPIANAFDPDLVMVSAGFDAASGDPLGEMEVSPSMFGRMCRQMMQVADEHADGQIVLSLEGGYNCEVTAECGAECVKALLREEGAGQERLSPEPGWEQAAVESFDKISRDLACRYRAFWPAIGDF